MKQSAVNDTQYLMDLAIRTYWDFRRFIQTPRFAETKTQQVLNNTQMVPLGATI